MVFKKRKDVMFVNKQENDVLYQLSKEPYINQRILADGCGHSLGIVNRSLKTLEENGYLDSDMKLTKKAMDAFKENSPRNAIILAAGFGMRMVPINMETTKGLLEVNGEVLIERIIRQLHEAGVYEIYVVVGFMKEHYEYLIDEYHVELIVNSEYAAKNNLHSLKKAVSHLSNTYIVPCDVWCEKNVFRKQELYSWYMVSDLVDDDSWVRVNRKMELVSVPDNASGNAMIGICYLTEEKAASVREKILAFSQDSRYDSSFWEEALYQKERMTVLARVVHFSDVTEINTYEQLRELDEKSGNLKSDAIDAICSHFKVQKNDIVNISVLKKGMTNRSFLFECRGGKYIMRIPGEGTDRLIDREKEAEVYHAVSGKGICDDLIYINPSNGYKISGFLENARVCDCFNDADVAACMRKLRSFHEMNLKVGHDFDLFGQIDLYESLWNGKNSVYQDYKRTKENILSLRTYIDAHVERKILTHIDAVPDNFLFTGDSREEQAIQLIDWEYAGMQDPHVDIAMFCIYSLYDREHVEKTIQFYFPEGCIRETRVKIYCYIAVCGLLWSNWCEYKRNLGIEFGEYSLRQYRFAKDYYGIAKDGIEKMEAQYEL